jgi:hypothetical protein
MSARPDHVSSSLGNRNSAGVRGAGDQQDPVVSAALGQHTQHDRAQRRQPHPASDDHLITAGR